MAADPPSSPTVDGGKEAGRKSKKRNLSEIDASSSPSKKQRVNKANADQQFKLKIDALLTPCNTLRIVLKCIPIRAQNKELEAYGQVTKKEGGFTIVLQEVDGTTVHVDCGESKDKFISAAILRSQVCVPTVACLPACLPACLTD
jgi:hypothetical protein